jgi:hypothetical protein
MKIDDMNYCDLCSSYHSNTSLYQSMDGSTYRLCADCIEMVCDSEPIDDDTPVYAEQEEDENERASDES